MTSALFNPAGGVYYHLRAFRYASELWSSFRFQLAEWLYAWEPPEKKLVLVGPSGGYCFQPFFFERFSEVVCLEPDPLARLIFAHRLRRAPLESRPKLRFFAEDRWLGEPGRFVEFLRAEGDAAVLLSNIVGQLRVLFAVDDPRAPELERVRASLTTALAGRSWASFHDRVSGAVEPMLGGFVASDHRLSDAELLAELYPAVDPETSGLGAGAPGGELLDHLTERFFPEDAPHAYFTWHLSPRLYHLIEATSARRDPGTP